MRRSFNLLVRVFVALGLVATVASAADAPQNMMMGALGAYPMMREASGTS